MESLHQKPILNKGYPLDSKQEKKDKNYMYIYDIKKKSIQYITSSFSRLTGYPELEINRDFLNQMIHQDDVAYVYKCEKESLDFMDKYEFEDLFNYMVLFSYRIKTRKGNYIRVLHESQALEIDYLGKLNKVLILHKQIDDFLKRPLDDFKIYDKANQQFINPNSCYNLTKRELEIVCLIKQGMSSLQISDLLHISSNTVRTHRKNILSKSSCTSFIELVKKLSY